MGIEAKLKELIKLSGKNLNVIASEASLDYATLHRFMNDNRRVQITFIEKLTEYFGLKLAFDRKQLEKVVEAIANTVLRKSGREFRCPNGELKQKELELFLLSKPLPTSSLGKVDKLAIQEFENLPVVDKQQIVNVAIGRICFIKALSESDQRMLRKLDQDLSEFRDSYDSLTKEEKAELLVDLKAIASSERRFRRFGSRHDYSVKVNVGHCYQNYDGEPEDFNSVSLSPSVMLSAFEAWEEGKEFAPQSIIGFL